MNKLVRFVSPRATVAALALMTLAQAHAAVDVASAVSGIAEAGAAILLVIGALLAMSVSIFGLGKAYGFIKRKAGA
jgi:hypothetical protein